MQRVPYTRIPGLTAQQQQQLDRNFAEAARQLDEGAGQVKVPYTRIPGLDAVTQRQIDRNFSELTCTGGGSFPENTVPINTVVTSDGFTGYPTGTDINGTDQDLVSGGAVFPWVATADAITRDDFGAGVWVAFPFNGGSAAAGAAIIMDATCPTDQPNVKVAVTIHTSPTLANSGIGAIARYTDANNYVYAYLFRNGATLEMRFGRILAGVDTSYGTISGPTGGATVNLHVSGNSALVYYGSTLINAVVDADMPTGSGTGIRMVRYAACPVNTFVVTTI